MTRETYTRMHFNRDLYDGRWAWPGGYPKYFITSDGEALSYEAAEQNADQIAQAIDERDNGDWHVVGCEINWEDPALYCSDTGKRIESAYTEDEANAA